MPVSLLKYIVVSSLVNSLRSCSRTTLSLISSRVILGFSSMNRTLPYAFTVLGLSYSSSLGSSFSLLLALALDLPLSSFPSSSNNSFTSLTPSALGSVMDGTGISPGFGTGVT
jgi:hypothetical protein